MAHYEIQIQIDSENVKSNKCLSLKMIVGAKTSSL